MSKPEWRRWPWLSWCVVAATLIGCQSIVASGVSRPRLAVLLPMGHRDAELRHNFLQGFRLGQASVEACGEPFPQVAWLGTIGPGYGRSDRMKSEDKTSRCCA